MNDINYDYISSLSFNNSLLDSMLCILQEYFVRILLHFKIYLILLIDHVFWVMSIVVGLVQALAIELSDVANWMSKMWQRC